MLGSQSIRAIPFLLFSELMDLDGFGWRQAASEHGFIRVYESERQCLSTMQSGPSESSLTQRSWSDVLM